ncbi:hypothetical protein [Clostridium perfringens]|uniref:hypothetical protein n=1 Tax=Clostridium perfringens TaxID=1502 RepID=UPI0018E44499|nr:hypothetical protein [Clostridium perfringens]MBI6054836.1 hypothetical protein [Clostridium perfringens]MDJ8930712.1 hypothetical protein [Clostridium perfringens]MDJ8951192.1 hypothetical protein [Clostridium perfringens]MDJ9043326.1 hypothetical protein [Clostridium perfringens]MDJ9050490.1 hypothetical protein [Clostridium perfringens]
MEIKGLSVEQLVDYINKELQKDEKLGINKLCDREGLKNSTVKSRLNRNGYKYNSEERKYYKITNSNSKSNTNSDTNSIAKINTKKKIKNDNSIEKIKDEKDTKDNTNIITNDILLDLMQNIKRLENRLDKIEKNTKDNTKVITKRNIKNNIGYMNIKNTKDTTTKSIRLYTEVKAELDKYIEEHKEVKVIDIVSFAILEYINKNK